MKKKIKENKKRNKGLKKGKCCFCYLHVSKLYLSENHHSIQNNFFLVAWASMRRGHERSSSV
jgi:hypothetical protein